MKKRNSRHAAFIEQIVAALNKGENARALLDSSSLCCRRLPSARCRSDVALITSWNNPSKKSKKKEATKTQTNLDKKSKPKKPRRPPNNTTTATTAVGDYKNTTSSAGNDFKNSGGSTTQPPAQDTAGAENGNATTPLPNQIPPEGGSTTTPPPGGDSTDISSATTPTIKIKKHIHPCACDLTPEQLRKIFEFEEQRRRSRQEFAKRLKSITRYLRSKEEALQKTGVRPRRKSSTQASRRRQEEEEEESYFREEIERVKIIKRRQKKPPQSRSRKRPEKKPRRRKGRRKAIKIKVGIMLKLNWKKPPIIPVRPTRTSKLRETESGYCSAKFRIEEPPSPPLDDFKIRINTANSPTVRESKTSSLRLQNAKGRIPPPSPPLKYGRAPFEANPRIYKHLKPRKIPMKVNLVDTLARTVLMEVNTMPTTDT